MKKLDEKINGDMYDFQERTIKKINEIIDHIGAIENDLEMMHWNSPKKLEVKPTRMKKITYNDIYCGDDWMKIYKNEYEMAEKINEICEWINDCEKETNKRR